MNDEAIARDVVVIGASAGGIPAVTELLSLLPDDLHAIIGVVIHRGNRSQSNWSAMLGKRTNLRVTEPLDGDPVTHGVVYVAPADQHMRWVNGLVRLDRGRKEHYTRPAVDPLFMSAAQGYRQRVVGIVLTGNGSDGARGLFEIAAAGGIAIAQTPGEAESPWMPRRAIERNRVVAILPLREIAAALTSLVRGSRWPI